MFPKSLDQFIDKEYPPDSVFKGDNLFLWLEESVSTGTVIEKRVDFLDRIKEYDPDLLMNIGSWKKGYALFICACLASKKNQINSPTIIQNNLNYLEREGCIKKAEGHEIKAKIKGVKNPLYHELAQWKWQLVDPGEHNSGPEIEIVDQNWNLLCPFPDWAWDAINQLIYSSEKGLVSQQHSIVIVNVTGKEQNHKLCLELVEGPGALVSYPDPRTMSFISSEENSNPTFAQSLVDAIKAVEYSGIYLNRKNVKIRWKVASTSAKYDFELFPFQGYSLSGSFALMLAKLVATVHSQNGQGAQRSW